MNGHCPNCDKQSCETMSPDRLDRLLVGSQCSAMLRSFFMGPDKASHVTVSIRWRTISTSTVSCTVLSHGDGHSVVSLIAPLTKPLWAPSLGINTVFWFVGHSMVSDSGGNTSMGRGHEKRVFKAVIL